ncbi:MAG: hypothetical protein AB8G11_08115 [Saprospiraceae bacterium]
MNKPTSYKSQVSRTVAGEIQVLANQKQMLVSKSDLSWLLRVFVMLILGSLLMYQMISSVPFYILLITSFVGYAILAIFFQQLINLN